MRKLMILVLAVLTAAATTVGSAQIGASAQDVGAGSARTASKDFLATYAELAAKSGPLTTADLARLGPDPALSWTVGRTNMEKALWRSLSQRIAGSNVPPNGQAAGEPEASYTEAEGAEGGSNDDPFSAEFVEGIGNGSDQLNKARIFGEMNVPEIPAAPVIGASVEDDGAIQLANQVDVASGEIVRLVGFIGDNPDYAADFDFYSVGVLAEGQQLNVRTDTSESELPPDTGLVIFDGNGEFFDFNDNFGAGSDSALSFTVPFSGSEWIVLVTSCCALPEDPFDPASGGPVPNQPGDYAIEIGIDAGGVASDADFYAVDLEAGDVISVGAAGSASEMIILAPDLATGMSSAGSSSGGFPFESNLRHQGNVGVDHVAAASGTHFIGVSGSSSGSYQVEIRVREPGLASKRGNKTQTLFLDFDGATMDTRRWGGPLGDNAQISGSEDFMFRWGLTPADTDTFIDLVVAVTEENLSEDLKRHGLNGDRDSSGRGTQHDIVVLNSRDHEDPWGKPNVSRVVVGGSINELGIGTIGIAESIDVGNLKAEESAIVLLDVLSGPSSDPSSLNSFPVAEGASKLEMVGVAVGNVVAHEAGHFFGGWHTTTENEIHSVMDEGGSVAALAEVGPDGIYGTNDDQDLDFEVDQFSNFEGFFGIEDPIARMSFALSTGRGNGMGAECTITGTEGDDVIVGTPGDDVICGLGGNDTIKGGRGNDIIRGGPGDDIIDGDNGRDTIFGGRGNDTLNGGKGQDRLLGGRGNDLLDGGAGNDTVKGGPGNDDAVDDPRDRITKGI